jgi:hypothetical protein
MVLHGNHSIESSRNLLRNYAPGYDLQIYKGYARITTTAAISWAVIDETTDQQMVISGTSGAGRGLIMRTEFNLERALVGTNGDRLKLGTSAADANGYMCQSAAVAGGVLAAATQSAVDTIQPFGVLHSTTTPITLQLFLHNGANAAPAGTLALAAGSNPSFLIVPVRVLVLRPALVVTTRDLNLSRDQQRLNTVVS